MVPIQFEYEEYGVRKFVVVLNMFKHHYSGTFMYRVRTDYMSLAGTPLSEELTLPESAVLEMLKTQVTD